MAKRESCTIQRDGRLLIVTLNRPERLNALHFPAHFELAEVWDEFAADPELWVAIITGVGNKAFCAGNDLRYQAEGHGRKRCPTGFAGLTNRYGLNKPLIAAVNGFAMGGGFEIALACDLIVAAENAIFALPEPRVGLMAGAGGVHRLPRIIGQGRAAELLLTGRAMPGEEARQAGFFNRLEEPERLLDASIAWAEQLASGPNFAHAMTKSQLNSEWDMPLETALEAEAQAQAICMHTEDFRRAYEAFVRREQPRFEGD